MARKLKFVCVIIIFCFLVLVPTKINGNPIFILFNFLSFLCNIISSHFSYVLLCSYFITAGVRCHKTSGCPKSMRCMVGFQMVCKMQQCKCVKLLTTIDFVPT
jgi:nucleoside recognition membrane protein YjiH